MAGIAVIPLEIVVFRQGADPTGKSTLAGVTRDIYKQSGMPDSMIAHVTESVVSTSKANPEIPCSYHRTPWFSAVPCDYYQLYRGYCEEGLLLYYLCAGQAGV